MGSLAADLKAEREKRNISLDQIAANTRISLHYLECLEEGRYGDLPGGMYNRAFLRAYCESLTLNQQEILQRYEAEIATHIEKHPKVKVQVSQKNSSLKPNPILIWSLALLISAFAIFLSRHWIAAVFSPYFSEGPEASLPQKMAPTSQVAQPTSKPLPEATQSSQTPPDALVQNAPETPQEAVTATANSPGLKPPDTPTALLPDTARSTQQAHLELELAITEQCWVSVEQDGIRSFRKLMDPGESQRFYATERFLITVGNAGGAHFRINGQTVKPLGKRGEVVRILINETNLQDYLVQTPG